MFLLQNISSKSEGTEIHIQEANNSGFGVSKHPLALEAHLMLGAGVELGHLSRPISQQPFPTTSPSPYGALSNIKGEQPRPYWWGRPCHNTSESLLFLEQWHLDLFKFTLSLPSEKSGVLEECGNSSLCCLSDRQTEELKSSSHFPLHHLWVLSRPGKLANL